MGGWECWLYRTLVSLWGSAALKNLGASSTSHLGSTAMTLRMYSLWVGRWVGGWVDGKVGESLAVGMRCCLHGWGEWRSIQPYRWVGGWVGRTWWS